MHKLIKNLFSPSKINELHSKHYDKFERKTENGITKNECLAHQLLYTNKEATREKTTRDICYETNSKKSRQAFDEQLKKYNINFYEDLHRDILKEYTEYTNSKKINKLINAKLKTIDADLPSELYDEYVFILIDGSCDSSYDKGNLITTNTLYFYNLNDNVNIDNFVCKKTKNKKNTKNTKTKTKKTRKIYNPSNKNSEIATFKEYIKKNHKNLQSMYKNKKIVFICDRAYHCIELFNLLHEHGFIFLTRLREKNNFIKENIKDKKIIEFKKKSKVGKYTIPLEIEYYNYAKKKKSKVKYNENYYILTNNLKFNDDIIQKLYNLRWMIEIFFKFNKKNTKLALSKERNINKHKISKICISIVNILIKFLLHFYVVEILMKDNENKKCNKNLMGKIEKLKFLNYSLLIKAMYEKILLKIVCCDIKKKELIYFLKCYISLFQNNSNRKFPRISLLPFSKWYIKKYHKSYNWNKIINAILTKTIDSLNKNLKTKAEKIKNNFIFEDT